MNGIIDVGGGLRGIYGAGVLDYCIDYGINFDYHIGVSAGSANLASFIAGQKGRNISFYCEYPSRIEDMSLYNFMKSGSYINLDYIYGELSNTDGENPLDYSTMKAAKKPFIIVAMNALTGGVKYFTMKDDMQQDEYDPLKASSCVPVVNKPYVIDKIPYYDGGMVDPIPLKKAFEDGCDKLVVILTRPKNYYRNSKKDRMFSRLIEHEYPQAAKTMRHRAEIYNTQLDLAKHYEAEGKVLIISPDDIGNLGTLTKDQKTLESLYEKGYKDAEAIKKFL